MNLVSVLNLRRLVFSLLFLSLFPFLMPCHEASKGYGGPRNHEPQF